MTLFLKNYFPGPFLGLSILILLGLLLQAQTTPPAHPAAASGVGISPASTPSNAHAFTAAPTSTFSPLPTSTFTPTTTPTRTNSPTGTLTPILTNTPTPTFTHTATITATVSPTPSSTATSTATFTSTPGVFQFSVSPKPDAQGQIHFQWGTTTAADEATLRVFTSGFRLVWEESFNQNEKPEFLTTDPHDVTWNGRDDQARPMPPGFYICFISVTVGKKSYESSAKTEIP